MGLRGATSPPSLVTLTLLAGIGALATNLFLPAINAMARDFGVDYAVMQLAVSLYLAASAGMQLFAGAISDRFGRRRVTLWALAIFVLASIGALLATNVYWFLVFRIAQATAGTGAVIARAVVRDTVPAEQAASRLGYVTMGMSLVPMLAPVAGGALAQSFSWHADFIVLLAAGMAMFLLIFSDMGETAPGTGQSIRVQMRGYPILAKSPLFWGYAGASTLSSGAFFAYLGGAAFVGETVYGLTPAQVGLWFMAPSIGYFLGNLISGRVAAHVGIDAMVRRGSAVVFVAMSAALLLWVIGLHQPLAFFGPVAVMGLGNGIVLPSANAGMMSVRPELAGTASGLGGALNMGGGAGLAAVAGAMLGPEASALPLITIMWLSAGGAMLSILALDYYMGRKKLA